MSRFRVFFAGAILLALAVLVGISGLAGSARATALKPPAPTQVHEPFQISRTYVPGAPAITPHAPPNSSGPAFTQADVIAYLDKYGFMPLAPGARLQILTIQFVTARQASQLMDGESVGRPDDYLVCYVKVAGPFLTAGLKLSPQAKKVPKTARYGDEVFDAHTGNLLVAGVYI
jgi:hypothetical protein